VGINKDFYVPKTKITYRDQEVCEVRGLTAEDIAQALSENAADMETLMQTFERDETLHGIDPSDDAQVTQAIEANTSRMFHTIITTVPDLAAKIIAMACDESDAWPYVKKKYVLPLQFDILAEIAALTFVDAKGFKEFLGKAMALAGNMGTSQRRLA
jgi:hypothetical protein